MFPLRNKSISYRIFPFIFIGLTVLMIGVGFYLWNQSKKKRISDLIYTSSVLKSYYELSFKQWELALFSVGQRILDIEGSDKKIKRLNYANEAIKFYDELLAFGFTDPNGEVLVFTGYSPNDSFPNLMLSENSRRSFMQVREAKNLVIGEAYYFPNVSDWILPIRVPLRDSSGTLLAVNTSAIQYKSINSELRKFNFNQNYRIQVNNTAFNTIQIYYPMNSSQYEEVLRKESSVFKGIENTSTENNLVFEAYNTYEGIKIIGVKTPLDNLNHNLIVSAPLSLVFDDFWSTFRKVLVTYVGLMFMTGFLFRFFIRKEKEYYRTLQSEQNYTENIIEVSPSIIIGVDKDLKCIFMNNTANEVLGYSYNDFQKSDWWKMIIPERLHDNTENLIDEIFEKKKLLDIEMPVISKSGKMNTVLWNFICIEEGKNIEIIAFGMDITAKKEAENLLVEREANLKSIFESTTSIIALFDREQRLIEYNSAFENYALATDGLKLEKGMPILDKLSQKEQAEAFRNFQLRALHGEKFKELLEYPGPNGPMYFMFSYNPIYNNEEITGVSMFAEDITELTQVQKKLEEYNENLESLIEERTKELNIKNEALVQSNNELEETLSNLKNTQQKLIQAEKMASLGVLSAGIGHEINNPLNFIQNGVVALHEEISKYKSKDIDLAQIEKLIEIINEGVSRANQIVKSLSHFSRKGTDMDEKVRIHEVLEHCLIMLHNRLKNRIEIKKDYCDENLSIKGNEGKLHQAFLNILSNAEMAIEKHGEITLRTYVIKGSLYVEVKDTGCGIPAKNMSKINDPFFTTKAPGVGTGLGLFITNSIIDEHSGNTSIFSEVNKGTTFTVILPVSS